MRGGGGHSATASYSYSAVPAMELSPVRPPSLQPPPVPVRCSSTASETSGSDRGIGQDSARGDRRRARLNSELLVAVLEGNLSDVTRLLNEGASANATCRRPRSTALQLAVVCGLQEVAQLLLVRGASVRMRDRAGRQAVHLATATGTLLLLQLILDHDPELVNSRVIPSADTPPLDTGCLDSWSHDHDAVAQKIPELSRGSTPLHLAVQRLHLECVVELLGRGGRVDLTDDRGLTPLDVMGEVPADPSTDIPADLAEALPTSEETRTRIENMRHRIAGNPSMRAKHMMFRFQDEPKERSTRSVPFQDFPADEPPSPIVLPNSFHPSDLSIVITSSPPAKKSSSTALKVVNELMKKGARMPKSIVVLKQGGAQNQMTLPMTCLHTAVELQDLQLIEYLLDQGACPMTWNSDGLTPLHLAIVRGLLDSLRVLLERNKSSQVVDARDSQGRTPLHLAVAEDWSSGVSLLLEAGADVKITSNDSQTVLHVAAVKEDSQLLEELLTIPESVKVLDSRNNVHETALCRAVTTGRLSCVSLLLSRGADITTSLPGDITLLHIAAGSGNHLILETLLRDARTDPLKNVRSKESKGGAASIHLAALGGHQRCVEALLIAGCDVYSTTTTIPHYGSTALHLAAARGHLHVVETIIRHDRNTLCVKNAEGWYPLHVAARFGKKESARHMLLNGANLAATVFNSGGYKKTALDIIVYSILHPVSFLESIFDCSLEVNDYHLHHPKCTVKVKYDLLQPLGPHRKQLKVLDSLLNCGKHTVQEKLLLHPLVETFLYLKWKKLRIFFFLIMSLYIAFTLSLTTMAMMYYVLKADSAVVESCATACRFTLCVSLTLITLQELLQATRMQRYYFKDLESWVKWSTFLLATVVVLGHHPASWLVHVSAVAVLLSWLELLFLLSRWPSALGFYILMFFTVAKNVARVLATFTFVILGFTFAFMIHFQATGPFENWWEALVKVMVMALEFDYGSMYEGVNGVNATSIVGRSIFLSFMVLVAIVLMNLLVGLAVSDIATLEKQGRAQRLAKQIEFLSLLEMFVYNRALFACCPKKLSEAVRRCRATEPNLLIEPGKPFRKTRNFLPQQLRQSVINSIINRKKKKEDDSCDDEGDFHNQDHSTVSKSTSQSSLAKINSQSESSYDEPVFDTHVKNSLEAIMNELTVIRKELESIKARSNVVTPTVFRPPSGDIGSQLFNT